MPKRQPHIPTLAGSAAILALAAVVPLVLVGEAAGVPGGASVAMVAGTSQERAETLARCVNEAARQLCGARQVLPPAVPAGEPLDAIEFAGVATTKSISRPYGPDLPHAVIDMPPPPR